MAAEWLNDKLSWIEPFVIQQQWSWVGQEAQDNVSVLNYLFSKGLYALIFFPTVLAW
jgi:hypothetical protein